MCTNEILLSPQEGADRDSNDLPIRVVVHSVLLAFYLLFTQGGGWHLNMTPIQFSGVKKAELHREVEGLLLFPHECRNESGSTQTSLEGFAAMVEGALLQRAAAHLEINLAIYSVLGAQ